MTDPQHAANVQGSSEQPPVTVSGASPASSSAASGSHVSHAEHPCPKGDECALNRGAVTCKHCGRNWPPDETWNAAKVRELCRHEPTVLVTACNAHLESYFTVCRHCERVVEVNVATGRVRAV